MAGRGSRFEGSGYNRPKPLILVNGVPMFIKSLESIKGIAYSKLVIVALKEHEEAFGINACLSEYGVLNAELVLIDDVTEGQLCTVLAAKLLIDKEEDILIIGSDTIVQSEMGKDIANKRTDCKGLISVADMPGDRWSFAAIDDEGKVVQVAEKQRISPYASTGMYYFASGKEFVRYGEEMVRDKDTTKGEYYVIPVYQRMIAKGEYVGISQATAMWDLGTPSSLNEYLESGKS
jgi:dTDP-glucose pyrophosphorylase